MSVAWRARKKMAQLFVMRCGAEANISLEMALRGHYRSKLFHWEVDLVEPLPPSVSKKHMREIFGKLVTIGEILVLADMPHLPNRLLGLFSQKIEVFMWSYHRTKILNPMMRAFILKKIAVVPSSLKASPSTLTSSFSVDPGSNSVLGGALDIIAQEWNSCAHPPATMKFLVGQSDAHIVGDLRYVAAQASALMVDSADQFCRSVKNKSLLKTMHDVISGLREELRDSEAECRVLSEKKYIVACEKATLEDHVM
ncbi:unnamed protein product [Lactuca saligna]|uniref:Uncharacterized protein n=1 Tax=Lactuca saligna TaxID=75948 RepID=A0AA35ZV13_LACSI|nr:unnamed protein product [Lactuca saligna]